MASLYKSRKET